ncbi:hypothetical protein [Aliivibrio salmonicida]|uniref:hypothetical protein n=1 Tax=Aliivibrio salmonicida TaxID=40269 RepID=UPI003D122E9D
MADYETLEKLIADKGEPVLIINSEGYKTLDLRKLEDVYEQYAFYLNESVSGGCIVYGQTSFGWIMNPSLRFPVTQLLKVVLESKEREVKAFSDKHESSFSKIARDLARDTSAPYVAMTFEAESRNDK